MHTDLPEIHVSDVKSFKECRWRWQWQSPLHHNLEPDKPVPHFLLGRAVHYALAEYYEGHDGVLAYQDFIEKDISLIEHLDIMADDEKSKIVENVELGRKMVAHYIAWAPPHDRGWEVLSTEMSFDVPMSGYRLAGRFDGVWRKVADGSLWIKEFKTSASHQLDWIYRDEQPMVYAYAAQRIFDQPIAGILYTFMFKKTPDYPRQLKNGDWSTAQNQNTTAELFVEALKADANEMYPGENQLPEHKVYFQGLIHRYQDYIQYLIDEKADKYFKRIEVQKTQVELENNMQWIHEAARDMVHAPAMYPAPNPIKCSRCAFKDPCRVRMGGGDPSTYLLEDFKERRPYEEVRSEGSAVEGVGGS